MTCKDITIATHRLAEALGKLAADHDGQVVLRVDGSPLRRGNQRTPRLLGR